MTRDQLESHGYQTLVILHGAVTNAVHNGEISAEQAGNLLMAYGAVSSAHMKQGVSLSAMEIEEKVRGLLIENQVDQVCEKLLGGGA